MAHSDEPPGAWPSGGDRAAAAHRDARAESEAFRWRHFIEPSIGVGRDGGRGRNDDDRRTTFAGSPAMMDGVG
jgi:hypothetical protein